MKFISFVNNKADFRRLLQDLEPIMHPKAIEQVREFIDYNEINLALETLCEFISEDEIVLNDDLIKRINELCLKLKLDKNYWIDPNKTNFQDNL